MDYYQQSCFKYNSGVQTEFDEIVIRNPLKLQLKCTIQLGV